jgi:endonuclease YncB( thermonuclease family)
VEVRFRDRTLTVRLIAIDTPESVAPGQPVGSFALRASAYAARRLEGERVGLEFDIERIDPFGRTLAYVWLGEEYVDRFQVAQCQARSADRGVSGRCVQEDACDPAYPDACIPPPHRISIAPTWTSRRSPSGLRIRTTSTATTMASAARRRAGRARH